eukprot:s1278_g9.t1
MGSSGKLAEDGEGLRQRFKRAQVKGGAHRGARYTDLSEAEIRRCATSYKGDPRFAQFCKQWVAINSLAPSAGDGPKPPEKTAITRTVEHHRNPATWKSWSLSLIMTAARFVWKLAKGRRLLACFFGLLMIIIVSRPAFATLISKLLVLLVRGVARRVFHVFALLVDGILDEAVAQVDSALKYPAPIAQEVHVAQPHEPVHSDTWHWIAHGVCIVAGMVYNRPPVPLANHDPPT